MNLLKQNQNKKNNSNRFLANKARNNNDMLNEDNIDLKK